MNAQDTRKQATYADVIALHRTLKVDTSQTLFKTNLDSLFEKAGQKHPGNQATELWKTVKGLASRTVSCIFSIVNGAVDKIFSDNIIEMTRKDKRVSFKDLGNKKVALFITTSPMNKTLQNLVNLLYADMLCESFESAE